MYRYENVQKGRLREFHQIGAELIGSSSYLADVDVILMANQIFKVLNIPNIQLNINSIGCPKCRSEYQKKLREFIGKNLENYCDTCKTRFEKNPMRILDCKEKRCKEFNVGAPMMIDYLCDEILINCKYNTLVLAHHTEYIKYIVEEVKRRMPDKIICCITGATKSKERDKIKQTLKENNNCVLIASYGCVVAQE